MRQSRTLKSTAAAALRTLPRIAAAGVVLIATHIAQPHSAVAASRPDQAPVPVAPQLATDDSTAERHFAADPKATMAEPAIAIRPLDVSAIDPSEFGDWDAIGHTTAVSDNR